MWRSFHESCLNMPLPPAFAAALDRLIPDLVKRFETPFHIYSAAGILDTFRHMNAGFDGNAFREYFAVKALPNPHILRLLAEEGSGFDCSSEVELQLASAVGARGDRLMFTGNNVSLREHELAMNLGALVTFDDVAMLRKVERLPEIVSFRMAPQAETTDAGFMSGVEGTKFGVPPDQLESAYYEAKCRGASAFGIHGMMCSNELNVDRLLRGAALVMKKAAELSKRLGITISHVNLGGGVGIPYQPEEKPIDFRYYAEKLIALRKELLPGHPVIQMECGRFVTGPHGALVCRVQNVSQKNRRIMGLDASMSSLMRPGFYGAYHHISVPGRSREPVVAQDVVGSLCENMDRFAIDRELPSAEEGDIVIIHDTGAHGHAMGFNYNGRLRPGELLIDLDGSVRQIRRPETFEDYVSTVPNFRKPARPGGKETKIAPDMDHSPLRSGGEPSARARAVGRH